MKLIFSNNDFKYELEGVAKLFFPAQKFEILFGGSDLRPPESDFCFLRLKKGRSFTYLYSVCDLNGKRTRSAEKVSAADENYIGECEMALGRTLYKALSKLTGILPEWGILTGVRPVKRVNGLLEKGMNEKAIRKVLSETFLCTGKKAELAYKTALAQSDALKEIRKESFSLYISIPFCPSRCSYCSFVSQSVEDSLGLIPEYIGRLCDEIQYTAGITADLGLVPDAVYIGGGTPTAVTAAELERVMKTVRECFDLSHLREYTVEAGRADTITEEKLFTIKNGGAGRISINPQSLSNVVLKAIGRRHTAEQFFESYAMARRVGFKVINTDLIAGLPSDTLLGFKNTLDQIVGLSPENITVHTLSIKRAARLSQGDKKELSNPAREMIEYANEKLFGCGYNPYYLYRQKNMVENLENTGWSKPGLESLYNIYIMEEAQTIIAVGAGASTKIIKPDRSDLTRIFNYKFPLEYIKHFDLMLKRKDLIKEFLSDEEKRYN